MNDILETNNLVKKHRDVYRIKDVNLRVPEHSVYGFLGPNGAGKTTTLKLILGLIRPDQGEIIAFRQKITEQNKMAFLRQTGSLIESPGGMGILPDSRICRLSRN